MPEGWSTPGEGSKPRPALPGACWALHSLDPPQPARLLARHTAAGRGNRATPRRRVCTWVAHLPTTVSTSFSMSALMYIRPRRSVWSVPHRLGTFITQRLCTFIIQAAGRRERKGHSALLSLLPKLSGCSEGMEGGELVLLLNGDVCEGFWDEHAANGSSKAARDSGRALSGHRDPPPPAVLGPAYSDYRAFSPHSNYLSFADLSNFSSITPMGQC